MNRNNGIADFTNAFISLLQGTLSIRDSIFISLGEELGNVSNYLTLQKYRYIDKFEVEIQCPEELKNCAIPNVMLQPIVENAIFHGIAPKEEKGFLRINVFKMDENLVISVEDDGVGMSQETMTDILYLNILYSSHQNIQKLPVYFITFRGLFQPFESSHAFAVRATPFNACSPNGSSMPAAAQSSLKLFFPPKDTKRRYLCHASL